MDAPTPKDPLSPIREFLETNYHPSPNYLQATLRISTAELYEKLALQFPFQGFTPEWLHALLQELGYQYEDGGYVKLEWLMIKKATFEHAS